MAAEDAFAGRAHVALNDDHLRGALRNATDLLGAMRPLSLRDLEDPDAVRDAAQAIRARVVRDLPRVLDAFETNVKATGGTVFRAHDAAAAVGYILDVARRHDAKVLVKGKSMASEEIHLNPALE